MEALSSIMAITAISLLAAISPGPDFCVIVKNSLSHSRKAGLLTALGVSIALIVHLTYTLFGIALVIAESPFLYSVTKYVGVVYLFYLGYSSIKASFKKGVSLDVSSANSKQSTSSLQAFMQGFLTNLLNPKAALFFVSLFSQFIDPTTPMFIRVEYAAINWAVTLVWFLFLAYIISDKKFIGKINAFRHYIERIMGGALLILGLKLLVA